MSSKRGDRPKSGDAGKIKSPAPQPKSYDREHPTFCLRYLQPGFDLNALDKDARAAFAMTLQKLASLTWGELRGQHKHKLGYEMLPANKFKASAPRGFDDAPQFMVFRYHGKLPMAGVRVNEVFHVLWIERHFRELYDHGGS